MNEKEERIVDLPLRKLGDKSLGVIIPAKILKQLNLEKDSFVRVILKEK